MLGRESVETAVECLRNRFLKIIRKFFKNTYEGVYFSVESKEYIKENVAISCIKQVTS